MGKLSRIKLPSVVIGEIPSEVHGLPCRCCPSAHFPIDPEMEDLCNAPIEVRAAHIFVCAWRPEKLCRGAFDLMKLAEAKKGE